MKLFYLHIPKTGGQTLASRLSTCFPLGRSSIMGPMLNFDDGPDLLIQLMEQYDFAERHVQGPILSNYSIGPIITTIRNPVYQIASNYLHVLREPRNKLHRPATLLPPRDFFQTFGDLLANGQCIYLVSSFFHLAPDPEPSRAFSKLMFDALDRIEYCVPTESIDEFCSLWTFESQLPIANDCVRINAAADSGLYSEIVEMVRTMPQLYFLDLLVWQTVRDRYVSFKKRVLRNAGSAGIVDSAMCSYEREGCVIYLESGWYPPQMKTDVGTAWWAGPSPFSSIFYRRKSFARFLKFSVVVVCDISLESICVLCDDMKTELPCFRAKIGDARCTYYVDLGGLPFCGRIYLWVPHVSSPMIVSATALENVRKSFATCDWEFVDVLPQS